MVLLIFHDLLHLPLTVTLLNEIYQGTELRLSIAIPRSILSMIFSYI